MENYQNMAKRLRKWFLYSIAVIIILTLVLPQKAFFLGMLIGAIISFYNQWVLQRKIHLLGEAVEKSVNKRTGLGTISRLAMAALGTLLVIHYDFSIVGFIIGLILTYPIIMIDFIVYNKN